jgi:thymidylate synthase (FAD)
MSKDFPLVSLISAPDDILKTIYTACRTCYSADYPINIWEADYDRDKMLGLVKKVLASGHHSTIEHCQFVFSISGVSRACTHQLVRHRHMSFSQKSQRYVTEKGQFEYIIPPTVQKSELLGEYEEFMVKISDFYAKMIEQGIPAEDARFVMPNAATSSLIASLNLREMIHLANLRLCVNAQHEIRTLVKKICAIVVEKEPWLKEYLVAKCDAKGYCDEIRGCGRYQPLKG